MVSRLMKYPCKGCICIPICRNKGYLKLVDECELISSYLRTPRKASKERNYPLTVLYNTFKPTRWYLEKGRSDFYFYDKDIILVRGNYE